MQYLSDQIESIQKRALKIIFPSLCYEDALKKSGLILLLQRREESCITFLKRSSDLQRNLVSPVAHTRPYALTTGETVSVPASSRTNRFGNFCTIKYQNHVLNSEMWDVLTLTVIFTCHNSKVFVCN